MANPRAEFSPIFHRPPLKLPNNARVAVWPVINVEEWDINEPMARTVLPTPQGVATLPDIPNFGWFDYGLRVGFWRFKQVLDKYGIRATVSLNASVCLSYPMLVEECTKSGWEMLAHGFIQRVINREPDERAVIRRTIDTIAEATGTAPRGWMGPGLAETFDTPDVLAEEGIEYIADWCNDDQPYEMIVKSGRDGGLALHRGAERHSHLPDPEPPLAGVVRAGQGPLRHAVPRGGRQRPRHVHFDAPLHHRRGPPHQVLRRHLRLHQPLRGRGLYDRQRDPRLVQRGCGER